MAQNWQIDGHYVTACNCDYGCPCNFNARPTPGYCEGLLGIAIAQGRYGDVVLDRTSIAMIAKWPGAIHEGNGRGVLFIDESTNDDQREALRVICSGDVGGAFGMVIKNTVPHLDGPLYAPVTIRIAGKESTIAVDGRARVTFDSIKNPVTGAESFPRVVLPQGLWSNELEQFTTAEFEAGEGDLAMSHPGKVGQIAEIHWHGP